MDITNFVISKRNDALLIGDYGSYRTALSRRILTLRRKLGRTSPKGKKYAAKAPITAEDIKSNHEFIHLQLLTAERAWAHALYMKSLHSAESDKAVTGSTRTHINSRLEKAKKTAAHLVDILSDPEAGATNRGLLEAQAYHSMIDGALQFEAHKWKRCLESYSIVHVIYTVLAQSANSKEAEIFRETITGTVETSIRYAAYQLSIPRTIPISRIVLQNVLKSSKAIESTLKLDPNALEDQTIQAKVEKGTSGRDLPKTITWRSRTVNIEDARIAQSLAAVYEAEEKLSKLLGSIPPWKLQEKASAYDEVLNPSQDAVDATKTAIDELSAEGVSTADKRLQALQVTRTALNYALIGWRVGRNRILCGRDDGSVLEPVQRRLKTKKNKREPRTFEESRGSKITRLRERVVLYDSTLQSIDSVRDLPGVAADQALGQDLDHKRNYFSALRSLALARYHVLVDHPKEGLALFARALSYASSVPATEPFVVPSTPLNLEVSSFDANRLKSLLQSLVTEHRALVEIHNLHAEAVKAEKAKQVGSTPFIERLDEYPLGGVDLTHLVDYPPRLRPIPVKPIFLDVAWNYIDYPGKVKEEVEALGAKQQETEAKEEKKETRRGWGWFGR